MLDLQQLRDAYERREWTKITWIIGDSNPADVLTKLKNNNKREPMLLNNVIEIQTFGWIYHPMPDSDIEDVEGQVLSLLKVKLRVLQKCDWVRHAAICFNN
jgi:hypothetical protein